LICCVNRNAVVKEWGEREIRDAGDSPGGRRETAITYFFSKE
jgi:hypothetical protein